MKCAGYGTNHHRNDAHKDVRAWVGRVYDLLPESEGDEALLEIAIDEGLCVASTVGEYDKSDLPGQGLGTYYDGETVYMNGLWGMKNTLVSVRFNLAHEIGHWREGKESGTRSMVNYGLDALLDDGYDHLAEEREERAQALEP